MAAYSKRTHSAYLPSTRSQAREPRIAEGSVVGVDSARRPQRLQAPRRHQRRPLGPGEYQQPPAPSSAGFPSAAHPGAAAGRSAPGDGREVKVAGLRCPLMASIRDSSSVDTLPSHLAHSAPSAP